MKYLNPSWKHEYIGWVFGLPRKIFGIWSLIVVSSLGIGHAALLNQENFENKEMAPWEIFITPNGTIGGAGFPMFVPFDMGNTGHASKSLQFQVGQMRSSSQHKKEQGGGVVIQIMTKTGALSLLADVAARYHSSEDKRNLAGGLFQWVVDDQVIVSQDVGAIENGGMVHHQLKAIHPVKAGVHSIRLRITRPFISHPEQEAPFQYADNVQISFSPIP